MRVTEFNKIVENQLHRIENLLIVKGAGHGLSYCVDAKSYEEAVEGFIKKVMG